MNMPSPLRTAATVSAAALLALSLSACGDRKDTVSGTPTSPASTAPAAPAAPVTPPAATTSPSSMSDAGAAVGTVAADAAITTKVNAAFANDSELSALRIDVDTKNGAVTLTGPAPTAAAKERATTMARAINGVTSVNNNLAVKG